MTCDITGMACMTSECNQWIAEYNEWAIVSVKGGDVQCRGATQVWGCDNGQGWRLSVVGGCEWLQLSSSLSGWSPHVSLWQPPSPPCAVWSMHALLSHSVHRVSSQLLCVYSDFLLNVPQSPQPRPTHNQHMEASYFVHYLFLLPVWLGLLCSH